MRIEGYLDPGSDFVETQPPRGPMKNRRQQRVHDLFTARAAEGPGRTAVVHGDARISYAELESRATRPAPPPAGQGAGQDSVVMVHLERSIATVVALLAVWKAGAVYLPVEPAAPDSRIATFVKETGCATVVTHERDLSRFAGLPVTAVTAHA